MNRRSFLQKLGLGAVIAAVAPKVIAEPSQEEYCEGLIPHLSKDYPCQDGPITNEQFIEWSKDIFQVRRDKNGFYLAANEWTDSIPNRPGTIQD